MSLEGLQERLAALQETTAQLRELIDRLADVEFQPGSVPLNIEEEGSVSGELSAEAGLILKNGLEDQQLLCEEAKYLRRSGHEKERLEDGIERVGQELASHRSSLRKARLSAKKSLERAQRLERQLMVQSFSEPISETNTSADGGSTEQSQVISRPLRPSYNQNRQLQSSLSEEDRQTVGASSNVTNALRRTHALIASELTKSEFARQTLTESSAALKKLDESYTSLDGMLASSRDLLGTLLKSQKSDTWYLQTALYMLMVTGAWLVFRRILYGPLWWLVWLPLRIVFGVGSTAGRAVMQSGGREAGQSGKAGVVIDGEIQVDGIPDESLPTAKVGREPKVTEEREDSDESMVEKVGKIVDAVNEADELGAIPGDVEDDDLQGRESAEVAVEDSRPRDEL